MPDDDAPAFTLRDLGRLAAHLQADPTPHPVDAVRGWLELREEDAALVARAMERVRDGYEEGP